MSKKSTFEILKAFEGKWSVITSFDNGSYIHGQANIKKVDNTLFFTTKYPSLINKELILHKFVIAQQGNNIYKIRENNHNIRIDIKVSEKMLKGHLEYQVWDRWFETDYLFYLDTNVFTVNKTITCLDGQSRENTIFVKADEVDVSIVGISISEA